MSPAGGAELLCPLRNRLVSNSPEEPGPSKRTIDQGGDALVHGDGKEGLLGVTVVDGVIELDEVHLLGLQDVRQVLVLRIPGRGDADVFHSTLLLHLPEKGQLGLPVSQIVDLVQADFAGSQTLLGLGDLCQARLPPLGSADLRGHEDLVGIPDLPDQLAQDYLRRTVGRRGIDESASQVGEEANNLHQLSVLLGGPGRAGEAAGGAQPHCRNLLS